MALTWWKNRVRMYFKNMREEKSDSLVLHMKSKYGKKKAIEEAIRLSNNAGPQGDHWGVPHFPPQRCCGLYDYSISQFNATLQDQNLLPIDMVLSSVLNKLNAGLQLKERKRTILFSGLHGACIKYGYMYPGPQKYMEMVAAILFSWKHLQNVIL